MSRNLTLAVLAAVLLMTACASLPFAPAGVISTPTAEYLMPDRPLTGAPAPLAVDAIVPIPLHVGHGIRGPWFELYFTDPSDPASAQSTGGVDDRLVEAIDAARLSVHMAIYNISLNNVRQALIRAHRRGVQVRVVTESDNLDGEDLQRLKEAGVAVLGDRREGTMHNKFIVIDRTDVWTGSMNFTPSGTYLDNNALMRFTSPDLAADYEAEFAEMFEDDKFGPEAGRITPQPRVDIAGTPVGVYFSPDDGVEAALVDLLDTARDSVYFLAYSFTSNPLGEAVRRADEAGIEVRGVMDQEQGSSNLGTELTAFRAEGLDVRLDGNPGQMHDKVMIIDQQVVVLGSYNFSRSANDTNDENLLVIYNRTIARQFVQEFNRIYATAVP